MRYKISEAASSDINNIWLYTFENWSLEQADRYFALIFDEIEYVSKNPLTGKDISKIKEGYRYSRVKSHYVFYKINQNVIEIIRVLHQKMNFETILVKQ